MSHAPSANVCNCGQRGWQPDVAHVPSVAKGGYGLAEGQMQPNAAVVHTIEGWQHVMASPSWTSNSYHFTFRRGDGWTIQHVPIFTPAWHAGRLDANAQPTWALWRPGINVNSHTIGLSAEGTAKQSGSPLPLAWTEPQILSAIRTLRWVGNVAGIEWNTDTLTEHQKINPLSRQDPGPRWPKERVLAGIGGYVDRDYTIIRPGEWLSRVSARVGISVTQLANLNNITDVNSVKAWQVLRLHSGVTLPVPPAPPVDAPAALAKLALAQVHTDAAKRILKGE
jgi:hypothetical protein